MTARGPEVRPGSKDLVSMYLAASLGTTGLGVAIVAVVIDSAVLAIIAGVIALLLALLCGWLLIVRRQALSELDTTKAKLRQLQSTVDDQSSSHRTATPDNKSHEGRTETEKTSEVRAAADAAGLTRVSGALKGPEDSDLTDARTGLLGEKYFRVTLDGRVASARRHLRPLALILLDVIEGSSHESPLHADPVKVAEIAQSTLRDADTLCRLDDGRFAMILEDTPENGAIWTVERIRRRINEEFDDTTAWAGVACYPAHGFDGAEVLAQARKAITSARDWRQDRTEVADS